jgi:hypothetical protein
MSFIVYSLLILIRRDSFYLMAPSLPKVRRS